MAEQFGKGEIPLTRITSAMAMAVATVPHTEKKRPRDHHWLYPAPTPPRPTPAAQVPGIPNRGPRLRVRTTDPGHFTRQKEGVKIRAIGSFAELATPTFFGPTFIFERTLISSWPGEAVRDGQSLLAQHAEVKRMV